MKRFRHYLVYVRRVRWTLALGIAAGLLFGLSSGFSIPFVFDKVFKSFFEGGETVYGLTPLLTALLLPVVFLVRGMAGYINQLAMQFAGHRILQDLRADLFARIESVPLAFFERHHSGDLISRLLQDANLLQRTVLSAAAELFRQPIQMLGAIGYIAYLTIEEQESIFMLLFLAMVPLVVLPVRFLGRRIKARGREVQRIAGAIAQSFGESIHAALEIRAFNLSERSKLKFEAHLKNFFDLNMRLARLEKTSQPYLEFVAVLLISLCFYIAYDRQIGFSTFGALGLALFFAFDPLKKLIRLYNDIQRTTGALERLDDILTSEREPAGGSYAPRDGTQGALAFRAVTFAYEGKQALFTGLSTEISAGTVCALVGPSGSGKTTFAKLVPRFYDPAAGRITLDGRDLRDYPIDFLRRQIAIVPQNPVLFSGTILDNILAGQPEASVEQARDAARAAHAEEFIVGLPQGYETQVGEDARLLSGGQRQRLALARAFLKDAPLLILDEATSALDSESEEKIQQALGTLVRGRTVLIIAHRLSTIRLADQILLFEHGRITASGTHSELMHRSQLYHALVEKQALAV